MQLLWCCKDSVCSDLMVCKLVVIHCTMKFLMQNPIFMYYLQMAAAPLYNNPVTCLCDNPAEYHCNTCGNTLCTKCKASHQKSKHTGHHSVVPYGERLRPEHFSSMSCPNHKGTKYTHWCQKCGKAACFDCITTTHNGHKMIKLETFIKEKTTLLQSDLANLESNELKQWEALMEEAKKTTANYIGQVNGVGKELDTRAKEFHAIVDETFKATRKLLEDIKKTNLSVLYQQEKMISDGLERVKREIKECEDKLRYGSIESLLQYEEKQENKKASLPKISPVKPPCLTISPIDKQTLTELFGELSEQQVKDSKAKIGATPLDSQKSTDNGTAKTGESESKSISQRNRKFSKEVTLPQRQLISTPSVQSSFRANLPSSFRYHQSIACVGSGQAWVMTGGKKLQLMDQRGRIKDTIDADCNDVVLSPQGELLVSYTYNKCIKSILPNKKVRTMFRAQWQPYGLCCLHSGNIAVTSFDEGRVVIYSRSGKIIHEFDKKLFRHPIRVAQNKVNNDLYICDKSETSYPCYGRVKALDTTYHLRYQYTGQFMHIFSPMDLCTDSAGHVLITDNDSGSLEILDKDGQHLLHVSLVQGLEWPISIDVDSDGNAWVGEERGQVKVLRYLQ